MNFVQIRHTHGAPPWGSEHARRAKRNRRKRDHGRHWPSIDRVRLVAGGGAGGDGTGSLGCGGSEHTGGAGGHGAYVEAFKDYKDSEGWFGGGYVLHMSASTHVGYQQLVPRQRPSTAVVFAHPGATRRRAESPCVLCWAESLGPLSGTLAMRAACLYRGNHMCSIMVGSWHDHDRLQMAIPLRHYATFWKCSCRNLYVAAAATGGRESNAEWALPLASAAPLRPCDVSRGTEHMGPPAHAAKPASSTRPPFKGPVRQLLTSL